MPESVPESLPESVPLPELSDSERSGASVNVSSSAASPVGVASPPSDGSRGAASLSVAGASVGGFVVSGVSVASAVPGVGSGLAGSGVVLMASSLTVRRIGPLASGYAGSAHSAVRRSPLTCGFPLDCSSSPGAWGSAKAPTPDERRPPTKSVGGLHCHVREGGFEPPRPFGHCDLNAARLPFRHSRVGTANCGVRPLRSPNRPLRRRLRRLPGLFADSSSLLSGPLVCAVGSPLPFSPTARVTGLPRAARYDRGPDETSHRKTIR